MRVARFCLLALGMCLIAALWGGISRLWSLSSAAAPALLVAYHGPLLGAFLFPGLIGMERAVALGRLWAWGAPVLALVGVFHLLLTGGLSYAWALGVGLFLLVQHLVLWRRVPGLPGFMPVLACLALLLVDEQARRGQAPSVSALGWATFLVLLIGGERLELSFVRRPKPLLLSAFLACSLLSLWFSAPHWLGFSWTALAWWLSTHDLARRNAFRSGLAAYSARAVLAGYFWLALSGLQLCFGGMPVGAAYDRVLHGVFVGFVLSMVMAHGPIVFPALGRIPIQFRPAFYLPLALLHFSLAVRCWGDLPLGAWGNFAAVLIFGLTMLANVRPGHHPWLRQS